MERIRVLLVDDHALFREGLASIVGAQADMEVIGEAEDGLEAVVKARQLEPDLILMDIEMPDMDGLEATRQIKHEHPEALIVILTVRGDDEKLFEAIKSGAQGYILKNIRSREMLAMLRGALRGEAALSPSLAGRMLEEFRRLSELVPPGTEAENVTLTAREKDVLGLVAADKQDKEIAAALNISLNTVKTHMRNILSKLQVSSRHEAAWVARKKGLV
jgi:DNA-binding NarL/FixJ family response regulator